MILALGAGQILFPTGNARLTTLLALAAFIALAIQRRWWLPVLGCAVWLSAFEAALALTLFGLGRPVGLDPIHFAVYLAITAGGLIVLVRRGYPPSWPLLLAGAIVWVVWAATGFHVNGHSTRDLDVPAEVWNELSKMLWAAAFFLPLVRPGRPSS